MRQCRLDFKAKKDPFPKSSKDVDQPLTNLQTDHDVAMDDKADDKADALKILSAFDLDSRYGPCIGLSRLERFNRAQKLGLNPDKRILEILETFSDPDVSECIWNHLK